MKKKYVSRKQKYVSQKLQSVSRKHTGVLNPKFHPPQVIGEGAELGLDFEAADGTLHWFRKCVSTNHRVCLGSSSVSRKQCVCVGSKGCV